MNAGGNTGDNIGSVETDAFQGHFHNVYFPGTFGGSTHREYTDQNPGSDSGAAPNLLLNKTLGGPVYADGAITDNVNGATRISSETRPKNVYINYIIKY